MMSCSAPECVIKFWSWTDSRNMFIQHARFLLDNDSPLIRLISIISCIKTSARVHIWKMKRSWKFHVPSSFRNLITMVWSDLSHPCRSACLHVNWQGATDHLIGCAQLADQAPNQLFSHAMNRLLQLLCETFTCSGKLIESRMTRSFFLAHCR